MKKKFHSSEESNHDEISELAFLLWEQAGCPAGRDREFWVKAEEQIVMPKGLPSKPLKAKDAGNRTMIKPAGRPRKKSMLKSKKSMETR